MVRAPTANWRTGFDSQRCRVFYYTHFNKCVDIWRVGRVVEGTSLLRRHTGLTLYREFESLILRQDCPAPDPQGRQTV
jgi:hypothetical protein